MKKIVAIALIVVLVFAMANVAFAATAVSPEKGNTNPSVTPGGKTSPQTGESVSVVWVALAALILMAVVLFCGKKLVTVK